MWRDYFRLAHDDGYTRSGATGVKLAADMVLASRDSVCLFGLALRDIQMPLMEGDETMPFGMAEPVAQQEFEESVSLFA